MSPQVLVISYGREPQLVVRLPEGADAWWVEATLDDYAESSGHGREKVDGQVVSLVDVDALA